MNRTEIIKNALSVLYSEFVVRNRLFVTYEAFDDDKIRITAGNQPNFNLVPRSEWDAKLKECNGPSMMLTTFEEFDGSCEITYRKSSRAKEYTVSWKNAADMVKECVDAVGVELYDQILVVLSINSYSIKPLMREGGEING